MSLGSPQYRKKAYAVAQRSTPDHAEFGPNEWLVDELHQQYLADKNSVGPAWWEFFPDRQPSDTPSGQSHQWGRAQEPSGSPPSRPAPSRPPQTAAPTPDRSVAAPTAPAQNGASPTVSAPPQPTATTPTVSTAASSTSPPTQVPEQAPSPAPTRPSTPLPRDIP